MLKLEREITNGKLKGFQHPKKENVPVKHVHPSRKSPPPPLKIFKFANVATYALIKA